ncbi:MAG: hypothetical protein IH851_03950 [Armatimonadetes bacterium]|nr:hypothetical protein [Armatimonadota bacterium]
MRRLLPFLLLGLLYGCNNETADSNGDVVLGEATETEYSRLGMHVGKRVKVRAWILGEGESYRVHGETEEYYFVLVPDPEVDWRAIVSGLQETDKLAGSLEPDPEPRADAYDVQVYRRLQQAASEWHGLMRGQEAREDAIAWGKFRRDFFGSDYGTLTDIPMILLSPSRAELQKATDGVFARYRTFANSVEVEITGKVIRTEDWTDNVESIVGSMQQSVRAKQFLIIVDSVNVLRNGADAANDPSGATGAAGQRATD